MDLRVYLEPLRKWWWLIAAATFIAAVSSFLASYRQQPTYLSRVTLMIGRTIEDPNPTTGQFYLAQQLAVTYADIANRELIRNKTMEALGLTWLPESNARALANTQLIEISVTDTNPQRAQIVANELANQLILQSPTGSRPEDQARQEFINEQLDLLQEQIKETQQKIAEYQEELGTLNSARQIEETQNEINALSSKMNDLQVNYANLLATTQSGALNILTIIEPANLPSSPVGPNKFLIVIFAAAVGFGLAAAAAFFLEYMDRTVKTSEDVARYLNVPVIGHIPEMPEKGESGTYVAEKPRSMIAEAFRTLRANIEFASVDGPLKSILISSPAMGDGKTTLATNLVISMDQAEKKVVLVDADMRRPSVHKALKLSNQPGLSDVFRERMNVFDAVRHWKEKHISILTAGNTPPNPSELLGSKRMDNILAGLEEAFDVVILDGPPMFITDAFILSAKVDGVLLVIEPGQIRQEQAKAIVDQLNRAGARVIGVVMNRLSLKDARSYGDYQYLSAYASKYYEAPDSDLANRKKKAKQPVSYEPREVPKQET